MSRSEKKSPARPLSAGPEDVIRTKVAGEKRPVDIVALVRSIQRAQGDDDCFLRNPQDCGRADCLWRHYCLHGLEVSEDEDGRDFSDREDSH